MNMRNHTQKQIQKISHRHFMKSVTHPLLFFTILFTATSLIAQQPMIQFEDYTLTNGIRVILHRDTSTPIACIDICYHVGSKDEVKGKTGFAHLFEHLMFDGSANVKRAEFDRYCERAGGFNNAYTTEDKTNYYMMLPANQLELGLWLESDRLLKLDITDYGLKTQREVVKEEKRQRVDNEPYGSTDTKFSELPFSVHPYSHPVIGSMDDISSAAMKDVVAFHELYYKPNNAVLVIAGDIEIGQTKKIIEKYFGEIPRGADVPRITAVEPPRKKQIREVVEDNVPLPGVFMVYNICAEKDSDFYAVDLLSDVIGSGESSRLYQALVYQQQIASSVTAYIDAREHPGIMVVYAIANPGVNERQLESALNAEIEKLKKAAIDARDLEKVKNRVESSFVRSLQTVQAKADRLAHFTTFYGKPQMINTVVKEYAGVSSADVQRVAQKYLITENSVILHYVPKADGKEK